MKKIKISNTAVFIIAFFAALLSCNDAELKHSSIEQVTDSTAQRSIFRSLVNLTAGTISETNERDSLAFLILPVQASCPSCRNKTIDSIVEKSNDTDDRHFIIISANGGRKTINGYFRENDKELPVIKDKLFLDTTNLALKYDLYDEKPTLYYSFNRRVYKKVAAIPATVREDLREFFSGYRNDVHQNE